MKTFIDHLGYNDRVLIHRPTAAKYIAEVASHDDVRGSVFAAIGLAMKVLSRRGLKDEKPTGASNALR